MKYAMTAALLVGLTACSPAAKPDAEKAKPGEVSEAVPDTASNDDIIVPDESVPADEGDGAASDDAHADEASTEKAN